MDFWRFTTLPTPSLDGSYDPVLVILSIAVACAAGTAALLLTDRMLSGPQSTPAKIWRYTTGALVTGLGIWTMHFTGMLAFSVPLDIAYEVRLTLLSLIPAVLGGGIALHFMARPNLSHKSLQLGALLLALGIATMHYTGMEAMRMTGVLRYDPWLFVLSIVIAHFLAMIAIYTRSSLTRFIELGHTRLQATAGCIIGLSIVSMHYTAMAATRIYDVPAPPSEGWIFPKTTMLTTIVAFAGGILCLGVVTIWIAQRSLRNRLYELAHTDALTGLPNRLRLHKELERELLCSRRDEHHLAVLFMDLVDFKSINDSLGHNAGDQILSVVADRLKGILREGDTVARLGGDEFVLIAPRLASSRDGEKIANRVTSALESPIECSGWNLSIRATIGISTYPENGETADELIQHADTAMYRAKAQGEQWCLYESQMAEHAIERIWLGVELRKALTDHQLQMHYQPWVDLASGLWLGVEALARWEHPTEGEISPSRFIPVAERSGLSVELCEWSLHTCCLQAHEWIDAEVPFGRIAFNLSAADLSRPDIVDRVGSILGKTGVPGTCLEFEVTESALMSNEEVVIERVQSLREMGLLLSLDDFGTGYSSLSYLRRLPVDKLKIDRSFVRNIATSPGDQAITRAVIEMGARLNFTVVAEGIETDIQRQKLLELGCSLGQGFLFARPDVAETIEMGYVAEAKA